MYKFGSSSTDSISDCIIGISRRGNDDSFRKLKRLL